MYSFRDVNDASEGVVLPSEAMKINGEYIENQISGYRTLNVSGREALSPDVVSYTTGVRDGSRLKSKRYPERIITVTYQLKAQTNEEFREAYNKLGAILNVEEAELIFNDEQDKFFIGTPCVIGAVKPGTNAVVGEFEILCTDPFKYSVIEYEAEPNLDETSILIDYGGTYKAFPTLEADFYKEEDTSEDGETVIELTGSGDCGYVAFFTEDEKIVQLGDPDEADGENAYAKKQTLVNTTFDKSTSWGTAAKSIWKLNSGITSSSAVEQAGSVAMGVAKYTEASKPAMTSGTLLKATSTADAPTFNYTITAKTEFRTADSVRMRISVTAALGRDSSYFGRGYGLRASLYLGGVWNNVTLKKTDEYWRGKTGHTVSFAVTINSNIAESTTQITGIKFKVERTDSLGKAGTLGETACNAFPISKFVSSVPDEYYLASSNYGTGANWHGPSITRVIPADASGEVGATDCTFYWKHKIGIGTGSNATSRLGAIQVLLVGGSGDDKKIVAGVNIYKGSSGKKANLRYYVNGAVAKTTTIDISSEVDASAMISKYGKEIIFNVGGRMEIFRDSAYANEVVNEITITFSQFGTKPALTYNGIYYAKFIKGNCDTWKDVPNKFSANDVVIADCKNGEIYLNDVLTPSLGALGNDWEYFILTPGLNQIGVAYSEWVDAAYAPRMKVRYREVFL